MYREATIWSEKLQNAFERRNVSLRGIVAFAAMCGRRLLTLTGHDDHRAFQAIGLADRFAQGGAVDPRVARDVCEEAKLALNSCDVGKRTYDAALSAYWAAAAVRHAINGDAEKAAVHASHAGDYAGDDEQEMGWQIEAIVRLGTLSPREDGGPGLPVDPDAFLAAVPPGLVGAHFDMAS
jgi:hypothetical protein